MNSNEIDYCPGDSLVRCNGQDIQRKRTSGKTKNRIMVVLPAQLAINKGTQALMYVCMHGIQI